MCAVVGWLVFLTGIRIYQTSASSTEAKLKYRLGPYPSMLHWRTDFVTLCEVDIVRTGDALAEKALGADPVSLGDGVVFDVDHCSRLLAHRGCGKRIKLRRQKGSECRAVLEWLLPSRSVEQAQDFSW